MKFLADMGISQSTVNWLKKQGYEAIHLREEGLERLPDINIIKKAIDEDSVLLTCDLDFGYLMAISSGLCPSIIIFRLEDESPVNVNKRLKQVLNESFDALEKGAVISVDEKRHRVRLLPI